MMDITGIWKYSELKKQYNAVVAELNTVKKTATQLTNENNDLKRELDMLGDEYQEYRRRAFEELGIKNIKVNMELNKAEACIKELEAKVSQPKWGYHEMMTTDGIRIAGWIPIEGTAYQILSKTPAMFPQFCKEKQVPEK
nr:MAG TPA: chromosome segregation protein [Caudoviricetes sp.]